MKSDLCSLMNVGHKPTQAFLSSVYRHQPLSLMGLNVELYYKGAQPLTFMSCHKKSHAAVRFESVLLSNKIALSFCLPKVSRRQLDVCFLTASNLI